MLTLDTVTVGSVPHPMTKEHFIEWVSLQTKCGNQRRALKLDAEPKVCSRSGERVDLSVGVKTKQQILILFR